MPVSELPILQETAAPRGVEADGRDPDFCGSEGVVSRPWLENGVGPAVAVATKVYFVTFGCQMNKYDTEMMEGALAANGYSFTDEPADADVILFNTCSVRQQAEDRVLGRLGALKRRRANDPDLTLGIVGCMAQRDGHNLMKKVPHLDFVLGAQMIDELPSVLAQVRAQGKRVIAVEQRAFVNFRGTVARRKSRHQAWLTITRGCDKRCTFCVVPMTRGPECSRTMANVLEEAKALVDDGAVEITLLGQTIETYGMDLKDIADGTCLSRLLETLYPLKQRGLKRLRFVTSHPLHLDERLVRTMADLRDLVCPFLHMPAQHGSNRMLRLMKRLYTVEHYIEKCAMVRALLSDAAIASDFIVGFCRETPADHLQSLALIESCRFSMSYLFKYSVRPGTPASRLPDDVPTEVKKQRHAELMAMQERVSLELNRGLIGRVEPVLVEGPSRTRRELLSGRTRTNRIVIFSGTEAGAGPDKLIGQGVLLRITDATALSLRGELVDNEQKQQQNQ